MKKAILLLVSGMLILSLAGSAMAVSTATVVMPGQITLNPNGVAIGEVSLSIIAQDVNVDSNDVPISLKSNPQTYTVELYPTVDGIEACIVNSAELNLPDDYTSEAWSTNALPLSTTFQTTSLNQEHTGTIYIRCTEAGNVKVRVYEGSEVL